MYASKYPSDPIGPQCWESGEICISNHGNTVDANTNAKTEGMAEGTVCATDY